MLGLNVEGVTKCVLLQHHDTPDNHKGIKFDFTAANYEKVNELIANYPPNYKASAVIPVLDIAQQQNGGWLSLASMDRIAEILGMAPIRVYEVATFYSMFNRSKVGKYYIQVWSCTTLRPQTCIPMPEHLLCGEHVCCCKGLRFADRVCAGVWHHTMPPQWVRRSSISTREASGYPHGADHRGWGIHPGRNGVHGMLCQRTNDCGVRLQQWCGGVLLQLLRRPHS